MKLRFLFLTFILLCSASRGQESKQININWVKQISGDFSFAKNWSYPLGVEKKKDGKAGCADGGFCPERCYAMLDSNGIVLRDSAKVFYQLLDTTHQFHSIQCEAECYEWAGTDIIHVKRTSKDSVYCMTETGIATHCSLHLSIVKDICSAYIDLNSIMKENSEIFYCTGGMISIDQKRWKKGIMKAEFDFTFEDKENKNNTLFWRGKIYTKIN